MLALLSFGFGAGVFVGSRRGVPFVGTETIWSIGIYVGDSPYSFQPPNGLANPVLTANDVTDVRAAFVADPFIIHEDEGWYMFFEVMNKQTQQGDIALATSEDGFHWDYKQIVLDEAYNISYPYVFRWQDEYYMLPGGFRANALRLYKATEFPLKWSFVGEIFKGQYTDASILRFNDMWWLWACSNPQQHDTLRLYYSEALGGPWAEHPNSPVISEDPNRARPGGRVIVWRDRIFRYGQDTFPTYGNQLRVFEVTHLTTTGYAEKEMKESPILQAGGFCWTQAGMHHIDPHQIERDQWIASVDGAQEVRAFGLRY